MAWLQGLAGKAENLLNRMDQTAADTLLHSPSTSAFGSSIDLAEKFHSAVKSHRHSNSSTSTTSDNALEGDHRSLPEEIWKDFDSLDTSMRRTASSQDFSSPRSSSFTGDKISRKNKLAKTKDADLLNYLNAKDADGQLSVSPSDKSAVLSSLVPPISEADAMAESELLQGKRRNFASFSKIHDLGID